METAQVIFFPIKWFPPFLEIERLDQLQAEIRHTNREIERQCKGDKYSEMVRKQGLANMLRSKIKLVK